MDPKQLSIGAVAIAALVVASINLASDKVTPKSTAEGDVAVTEIAKVGDNAAAVKLCTREWVTVKVATGPELKWLCDGVYLPAQQAWLDKTAGADGMRIELTPRDDGKGGIVVDATVTKGEPPVYQPPPVEPVKSEVAEGEIIP